MTTRSTLLVVSVSCLVAVFFLSGLFARDPAPSSWKALEIQYAQANVELAQARLAQAQSQNNQAKGTISQDMIDMLKGGVKLTQDRLKQLESSSGNGANAYAPQIMAGEDVLKGLIDDHNESLQANKLQAGAVSEPQLRREQAEIKMAKARLATLKALAQQPLEVRLECQIHQLQDDIRALWARPLITD